MSDVYAELLAEVRAVADSRRPDAFAANAERIERERVKMLERARRERVERPITLRIAR